MKRARISASDADEMTALMILDIVVSATFFGGYEVSSIMKRCPPALLREFASERYNASLSPVSIVALAR